jgi:hypothetical protein
MLTAYFESIFLVITVFNVIDSLLLCHCSVTNNLYYFSSVFPIDPKSGTQAKPSAPALYTRVMFTDVHPPMIVEGSGYFLPRDDGSTRGTLHEPWVSH